MELPANINPLLKTLKLTGILDSLSLRNKEAIDNKLSFLEFFTLVLQDEIARREQKRFEQRFTRSNLASHKTLDQFDFSFNPKINQRQVIDLATCRFIKEKVSVLIVGPCGTGKSHLSQAIGHCALRLGIETLLVSQTTLFAELNKAQAVGNYTKVFQKFVNLPLLIIDDFGLKPLRIPQDEQLHDLVTARYEQAATIVSSNLAFSEWGEAFPNKLLGVATLDRLQHGAYRLILDGQSYRRKNSKSPATNSDVIQLDFKEN